MSPMIPGLFVVGVAALIAGAELLVRGASRLAASMGVSALVIGLTVVAFGTGSPELAVAIRSAMVGQADIAFGNAVGSNIFNVLLVLGVSAAIRPLAVAEQLIRMDVPIMIAVSALLYLLVADGVLTRVEGVLLLVGQVGYTLLLAHLARREPPAEQKQFQEALGVTRRTAGDVGINLLLVGLGIILLLLGARWLVDAAVALAELLGMSQLVIGLTIVAAGTSLPEVATSVIAGIRGERDIAVGNVVGSNIFNILAVLGMVAVLAPGGVQVQGAALNFDVPVMLAVAIACLPIFFNGQAITRWEGLLFVGYYIAFTTYLVLQSARHDVLPAFSRVMSFFVIPLTLATLVAVTVQSIRRHRRQVRR